MSAYQFEAGVGNGLLHFSSSMVIVACGFDFLEAEIAELLERSGEIFWKQFANRVELQAEWELLDSCEQAIAFNQGRGANERGCASFHKVSAGLIHFVS